MRKKEVSDVWMLEKTTTLDQLIIHEGAQIHTPDGKFVAMTINGSGTPITPGTYYGDIVLTVADTCHMPPHGLKNSDVHLSSTTMRLLKNNP